MTEKNRRVSKIAGTILLLLIITAGFHWREERSLPAPATPPTLPSPRPPDKILTGKIEQGQTLSTALRSLELPHNLSTSVCNELQFVVNLRRVNPWDSFEIRFARTGELTHFSFRTEPLDIYHPSPASDAGWRVWKEDIQIDRYWTRIEGEIISSLFEAVAALGGRRRSSCGGSWRSGKQASRSIWSRRREIPVPRG